MKISVCLIVKNEEEVIDRCLSYASVFADEIILVDTGSDDKTKKLARKYTDKIFDFKWEDDFSAARNFSFSKATCDYIMWLDADDVIREEEAKKILALKRQKDLADVYMFKYAISFDHDRPQFVFYRERLLRRNMGFVWEGFIHEAITPRGVINYQDIVIEHRKEKAGDPKRNLKIYRRHLRKGEKLSPREQYYYAKELFYNRYIKKCIGELKKFLKMEGGYLPNILDAKLTLGRCNASIKNYKNALFWLFQALETSPNSEVCCEIGDSFSAMGQETKAKQFYKFALQCPKPTKTGEFFNEFYYYTYPYLQLVSLCWRSGQREEAKKFHLLAKKGAPDNEIVKYNEKFFV